MKFKTMRIENFKGIRNSEYDLSPTVVAILGNNGTGKTSFLDAYNRIYTGQMSDSLVRTGSSSATIEATLENGVRVAHIRKSKKMLKTPVTEHRIDDKKKTLDETRLYLEQHSGSKAETLSVLSSSKMLQEMAPADLSKFLLNHLSVKVTGKELNTMLGNCELHNPQIINDHITEGNEYDQDELSRLYEKIAEERLVASRDLKSIKAYINNYSGYIPKEGRTAKFLDDEIMGLMKQIAAAEEAQKNAEKQKKIMETVENIKKRYAVVSEEYRSITVKPDGSDTQIMADIKRLEEDIELLQENIVKAKNNIEFFEKVLAAIEKGKCPIYDRMRCSVNWDRYKREFASQIDENQSIIAKNTKSKSEKEKEKSILDKRLEEYRTVVNMWKRKEQLYLEIDSLKKSMPKKEDMIEIKEDEIPDISTLKASLVSLQKERKNIDECEVYKKKVEELLQVKELYDDLDMLCKELDPKGSVVNYILNNYIKKMQQICNKTAARYRQGFEIKLHMQQGLHVYCRPRAGEPLVEFANASSGEKACIMISLVDMLCDITGNKIMALDDLEKLDTEMLESVLQIITDLEFSKKYDHIILAGVGHQDTVNICKKYNIHLL